MKALRNAIDAAGSILLITHVNPDGDAVGSTLALRMALEKYGKKVTGVCDGRLTEKYAFLERAGRLLKPEEAQGVYDLAIAIDCADKNRMGEAEKLFDRAKDNANLDHHVMNEGFARINVVREASSCGEMVFELIGMLQTGVDALTAECLYIAISTDTGHFTYSNTNPKAFCYTAELIGLFDHVRTAERLYRTRSYGNTKLIARAIDSLSLHADGRVALMCLSQEDIAQAGVQNPDYEMVINFASEIDTVFVAIFLRGLKDGGCKVSLRSSGDIDVAALCLAHGGGGHRNAAGCMLRVGLEEAKGMILKEVTELL